ncbi:MAG TPA: type II 3-dehydroquinate dehydratase [Gammaproteobacteria bacterium]|nr:type II 3-dehydroquinate dehydratase [Gammaproteobacteria bacterium]
MRKIAIINGPNLNLLGSREKNVYGNLSLAEVNQHLTQFAESLGFRLEFIQSNIEGELVNYIQQLKDRATAIIINAGAYTHTSIAIRDALLAVALPFIEVHLSNVDKREEFRKHSYLSDIASGVIYGFGPMGYELALQAAAKMVL